MRYTKLVHPGSPETGASDTVRSSAWKKQGGLISSPRSDGGAVPPAHPCLTDPSLTRLRLEETYKRYPARLDWS